MTPTRTPTSTLTRRVPLTPLSLVALVGVLVVGLACQSAEFDESSDGAGEAETGDGNGDGDGDGDDTGENQPTYNCDPDSDAPCPEGEKCTVLQTGGPPLYECVPNDTDKLSYEACTPAPGTGQDGCPTNHACITASSGDELGQCLPLCKSDAGCDAAICVAPPSSQIPVCAAICDPLAPLCPDSQDCQRVRKSNFVCQFPLPDDNGVTGETCNGGTDTGCAEGFVCETGAIVPGCIELNCCTSLCDLSEPEFCESPTLCGELPLDPQPGLENVGACYVPQ